MEDKKPNPLVAREIKKCKIDWLRFQVGRIVNDETIFKTGGKVVVSRFHLCGFGRTEAEAWRMARVTAYPDPKPEGP